MVLRDSEPSKGVPSTMRIEFIEFQRNSKEAQSHGISFSVLNKSQCREEML